MDINTNLQVNSEQELKELFIELIKDDFGYKEQVKGYNHMNGELQGYYYDLVICAKKHLVNKGFPNKPIVIEIKYFKCKDSQKLVRAMKQTNDYSTGFYYSNGKRYIPCMALLVTNLIFSKKYTHENKNFFNQNGRANTGWAQLITENQSSKIKYSFFMSQDIKIMERQNGKFLKEPIDKKRYLMKQVGSATKINMS